MEIEVSAFGNFSTDTGSTDCNQVNINVFRYRRSRPSVPHGANFYFKLFYFHLLLFWIVYYHFAFIYVSISVLLMEST